MPRIRMNEYIRAWDNKSRKWVYFHRLLMENMIGRKLTKHEHVHHKDGNVTHNNMCNLEITTLEGHIKKHKPYNKKPVVMCIMGCKKPQHARGYCKACYERKRRAGYFGTVAVKVKLSCRERAFK